jgi:hypothetical protein
MPTVKEINLIRERDQLKADLEEANEKIASFQRRQDAEDFLCGIMEDPRTPLQFRPSITGDFLQKRAQIEEIGDIKAARSAVKMAQVGSFEIGDVNDESPGHAPSTGSKADDEFTNWLVSSENTI